MTLARGCEIRVSMPCAMPNASRNQYQYQSSKRLKAAYASSSIPKWRCRPYAPAHEVIRAALPASMTLPPLNITQSRT